MVRNITTVYCSIFELAFCLGFVLNLMAVPQVLFCSKILSKTVNFV